ncbi:MAG: hypothetical protein QMC79_04480 [Anaerosomatales bacterium]|nr:hypothetical protein [Anaerosomatales bacterium]
MTRTDKDGSRETTARQGIHAYVSMGTFIALGAALGLVVGLLAEQMVIGLAIGAGLGTVGGAVFETYRKR